MNLYALLTTKIKTTLKMMYPNGILRCTVYRYQFILGSAMQCNLCIMYHCKNMDRTVVEYITQQVENCCYKYRQIVYAPNLDLKILNIEISCMKSFRWRPLNQYIISSQCCTNTLTKCYAITIFGVITIILHVRFSMDRLFIE